MEKVHENNKNSVQIKMKNSANLVIWLLVLSQDLTECIVVPPIFPLDILVSSYVRPHGLSRPFDPKSKVFDTA